MMIRKIAKCLSCARTTTVRTAIGRRDLQEHTFPCQHCGIEITFTLTLDRGKVGFSFADPTNANWIDYSEDAYSESVGTVTLDGELLAPKDLKGRITPFLAVAFKFHDIIDYRKQEQLRESFRELYWPGITRLAHHYERNASKLFDGELAKLKISQKPGDTLERFMVLTRLLGGCRRFVLEPQHAGLEISQRLSLATNIDRQLVHDHFDRYHGDGKLRELWRQSVNVRSAFMKTYSALSQVLQVRYWREFPDDWGEVAVAQKEFDALRALYIDSFETVCRLSGLAIGLECIINHRSLELPTNNGTMTLRKYEKMANAGKWHYIDRYPISSAFQVIDSTRLRNGIGHHSAYYNAEEDTVVCVKDTDTGTEEWVLSYSEFCYKVLRLVTAHLALDQYLFLAIASFDGNLTTP